MKHGLWLTFAAILLAAIGATAYIIWQHLAEVESTDDAQIDGTIVPVSARVGGYVTGVFAGDQQYVKQAETLVQLDKRDYDIAVARAQADLANAQAGMLGARGAVPVSKSA
jgi:membrane fusion protein, multidrug efflux system